MKQTMNSKPESATTPFCFVLSSFALSLLESVSGAQIMNTTPMMIIGMNSRRMSRHAPGKQNVPAGAKSKAAIMASPTASFVNALMNSFIKVYPLTVQM